jgi:DNA-binding MarR family transcriptional regulator
VNRLETRGYVVRSASRGDRRQVIVRLTVSGSSVLRKLSLAHHEELEKAGPALAQALRLLMKQTRGRGRNAA